MTQVMMMIVLQIIVIIPVITESIVTGTHCFVCAVGQQSRLLLWRDQQPWVQAAAEAPRHAEASCGPKCRLKTEAGGQTAGPGPGAGPGAGAEAGKLMTGSGSGQIMPVRPGADEGPGTGPGDQAL